MWLVDMQFGQEYFPGKTADKEIGNLWPVASAEKQ